MDGWGKAWLEPLGRQGTLGSQAGNRHIKAGRTRSWNLCATTAVPRGACHLLQPLNTAPRQSRAGAVWGAPQAFIDMLWERGALISKALRATLIKNTQGISCISVPMLENAGKAL